MSWKRAVSVSVALLIVAGLIVLGGRASSRNMTLSQVFSPSGISQLITNAPPTIYANPLVDDPSMPAGQKAINPNDPAVQAALAAKGDIQVCDSKGQNCHPISASKTGCTTYSLQQLVQDQASIQAQIMSTGSSPNADKLDQAARQFAYDYHQQIVGKGLLPIIVTPGFVSMRTPTNQGSTGQVTYIASFSIVYPDGLRTSAGWPWTLSFECIDHQLAVTGGGAGSI